jgi:hypothetical protein
VMERGRAGHPNPRPGAPAMLSKTAYCRPTSARFFEISGWRVVGRLPL